jgi:gliding motility-associated-like protein
VITVNVYPDLEGIMTVDPEVITIDVYLGEEAQLNAEGAVDYTWTPATGLNATNIPNPIATPSDTTIYIVTGIDANGCVDVDTVQVNVIGELEIFTPGAFSPNGDGVNDTWFPIITGSGCIDGYTIYNRYGEVVYEHGAQCPQECLPPNNSCGWNGKVGDAEQPVSTFVVVIRASTSTGVQSMVSSNFTLVR